MDAKTTFSNTQVIVGLVIGILTLLGLGIAVGRVLEKIANAEKRVEQSLEAFKVTLTDVVKELTEQLREVHETGPIILRSEWSQWRTGVDRDIGALQRTDKTQGESIHVLRGKMQKYELNQARIANQIDLDLNEG